MLHLKNKYMKSNRLFSVMIAAIALSLSTSAFAQQGMGRTNKQQAAPDDQPMHQECKKDCHRGQMEFEFLKLTDEQKARIKDLKLAHTKETMKLKGKMGELHAHLQTLSTADVADMKAINATIDEITQTQNQMMKSREGFKQQVRSLLTEEQRIEFDQKEGQQFQRGGMRMHERPEGKDE
jgi:Spy/CpxP family protein refolding chaperone